MDKTVLEFINKVEGWKTAIKALHWDADNMSQHKLCDDIADRIADFQDQVSEVEQSINGKLKINKLKPIPYKVKDLKSFVENVLDDTNVFMKSLERKGDTYVGMKSDCESFLIDMQRNLYLVGFTLKEDIKRRLKRKINESRPKNPSFIEDGDRETFLGRRVKSAKGRINQIYKVVKKYGVDNRLYSDEHWQAVADYRKVIGSIIGVDDIDIIPCADLSKPDWDIQSDGGYTDYDPSDNMPRSKQYKITITYDDGMKISGYIKCMAAGTIEDPFSKYDTCMVLWPKSNRVIENKNHEIRLTENELKEVIREVAINLLNNIL